jgi:hypothetical protein
MTYRTPIHETVLGRVVLSDTPFMGEPCWIFTGRRDSSGYGKVRLEVGTTGAHRLTYQYFVGPIPDGLHIDHLCRVRSCCNPMHLEAVTPAENNARALPYRRARSALECRRGHTRIPGDSGCAECAREAARRRENTPERRAYKREYRRRRRAAGFKS